MQEDLLESHSRLPAFLRIKLANLANLLANLIDFRIHPLLRVLRALFRQAAFHRVRVLLRVWGRKTNLLVGVLFFNFLLPCLNLG